LERYPRAAVRQHVSIAGASRIERRAHALADRFVPGAFVFLDVDPGVSVPERKLCDMGTRPISARYKWSLLLLYRLQRFGDILYAFDRGRIALRADQHKIVVHDRITLHALAFGEEFFFG